MMFSQGKEREDAIDHSTLNFKDKSMVTLVAVAFYNLPVWCLELAVILLININVNIKLNDISQ